MAILNRIIILLYVTLTLFIGCYILLFSLHVIDYDVFTDIVEVVYFNNTLRFVLGVLSAILLVINFIYYKFFSINIHKDKIIAFDNPSGRVSVSLVAFEDLIKRMTLKLSEIRDIKVNISASRKGLLLIKLKLILNAEVNIPTITSKIQAMVTKKVQDIIGLEERVNVEIYVGRIFLEKFRQRRQTDVKEEEPVNPSVPFHGYRA